MSIDDIIQHNKELQEEYKELHISFLKEKHRIKEAIIDPCKYCPYDGLYRCETCEENFYEGFNKKDYPEV